MIRIASEKELLDSFRPLDREAGDEIEIPRDLRFPIVLKDYLAWTESSGSRVYLVFLDRDRRSPVGIVFRRDQSGGSTSSRMCEWCHAVRSGDGVRLLTAAASSCRRVGVQVCADLSCKDKVVSLPGAHDVPETLDRRERMSRILRQMATFAKRNLF